MIILLSYVFDIVVAIIVYKYLKLDRKKEAYAAVVIIKIAYYVAATIVLKTGMGLLDFVMFIIVILCMGILYEKLAECMFSKKFNPVLFVIIMSIFGAVLLTIFGNVLSVVFSKLFSLFQITFNTALQKIS